ncbi:MAG: hypothetical protein AB8F34_09600 [Akkermansiaceae bacterium]
MSSLTFVFLVSIGLIQAEANKTHIDSIRDTYKKTNTKIETTEKSAEAAKASSISVDHYITNALNRSWEAVGNYKSTYKYYYIHDAPNGTNQLLKMTKASESAARRYHEEFYYNEAGELIFYFQKTNDVDFPKERRIYFHKGKAIRLIDDKYSRDGYTEGDKEMIKILRKREKSIMLKFTSK